MPVWSLLSSDLAAHQATHILRPSEVPHEDVAGRIGVLALLAGCERRRDQETTRSGTDTIIRSSTVKDTTVVRADTSIDVDTLRKTGHVAAGDEDTAAPGPLEWGPQPPGLPAGPGCGSTRQPVEGRPLYPPG